MQESLGQYRVRDEKLLSFRKWAGTRDVIIYLHGIESSSYWFTTLASGLNEKGFTLYGLDRRGSGLNKEDIADINDYNIFLNDIEDAVKTIREQNVGKKIYIMGICWGGLLAVNYAVRGKALPDALILLSPAIYRRVGFNPCVRTFLKMCFLINPQISFKIPIKDKMFTANKKYLDFIGKDTMRLRFLTVNFFNQIMKMERDFSEVNHKINLPVSVLLAGHDDIVDNNKVRKWFGRLDSTDKTIQVFDNFRHVMPFEDNITPIVDFITNWIGKMRSNEAISYGTGIEHV